MNDFLSKTIKARRQGDNIFKMPGERSLSTQNSKYTKNNFQKQSQNEDIFRQRLREFLCNRSALQEIVRKFLKLKAEENVIR